MLAEAVHFGGIAVLAYKLVRKRNCGGLSLQTQILTAAFLGIRLLCSFMMEYDIHTLLVRDRERQRRRERRREGRGKKKKKKERRTKKRKEKKSSPPTILLPVS